MEALPTKRSAPAPNQDPAPSAADRVPFELWQKIVARGRGDIRFPSAVRLLNRAAAEGGRKQLYRLAGIYTWAQERDARFGAVELAMGHVLANQNLTTTHNRMCGEKRFTIYAAYATTRRTVNTLLDQHLRAMKNRDWAAAKGLICAMRTIRDDTGLIDQFYGMALATSAMDLARVMM
jgi:hypothetical protein